jgi:uncharacterized protein
MNSVRRIVIDTGVLISAAIRPESIPALALAKALLLFDVCVSDETLAELSRVLERSKFDRYLATDRRLAFIEGLRQKATRIEVDQPVTDCPDPDDNKFLALALCAEAELILSSDPHLTDMHPWRGIPIMPPAAFLIGVH